MWCVISPSSWCPSCTVTAGWASGMGGLISRLSIRSLLAVLEMGGNTIPLQFDFKPHRSISWTPFSSSSFYHSFPHTLTLSFALSFILSPAHCLLFFFHFFPSVIVIWFSSEWPVFGDLWLKQNLQQWQVQNGNVMVTFLSCFTLETVYWNCNSDY